MQIEEAVAIWRGFLGPLQANVILTEARREALRVLVEAGEAQLQAQERAKEALQELQKTLEAGEALAKERRETP